MWGLGVSGVRDLYTSFFGLQRALQCLLRGLQGSVLSSLPFVAV